MKEDILEQLVEDWFVSRTGWFVKHNIKYRPDKKHKEYNSNKDSVHSDIDILAFSNILKGKESVAVVTCKSWQDGFNIKEWKSNLESNPEYNKRSIDFKPREKWKYFRELTSDKWMEAFINKIKEETNQVDFIYYIAVTKLKGTKIDQDNFENSKIIKDRFLKYNSSIDLRILTLEEIINDYFIRINKKDTPALEATDVGRLLQLFNAADLSVKKNNKE